MNDLRTIIMFAFRYSLGRRSTAPSFVMSYIKKHINLFTEQDLHQMYDEIDEQARCKDLGDPNIDEPMWRDFQCYLKERWILEHK